MCYKVFSSAIFILLLLLSSIGHAQRKSNFIYFDQQAEVNWKNFKGKANKLSSYQALSYTGIELSMSTAPEGLIIHVYTVFNPRKSWTKDKKSDYLLQHEQLHFDITELYARKFRKALKEHKFKAFGAEQFKEVQRLYKIYYTELEKFQSLYDKESDHSKNKAQEAQWQARVYQELLDLQAYQETTLTIPRE